MSFQTFKNKYLGKRVDTDGFPKGAIYQCVDLIKSYMKEEFSIAYGSYGNAIDYWTKPAQAVLNKFRKVSTSNVQQGDIVPLKTVGRSDFSGDGHIGIATGNQTATTVEILEQNGSTGKGQGTGADAIRTRYVPKSRIPGVLRPKSGNPAIPSPTGGSFRVKPGHTFRIYKPGTTTVITRLTHADGWYKKRGKDSKYPNRWLANSARYGVFAFPYADRAMNVYKGEFEEV